MTMRTKTYTAEESVGIGTRILKRDAETLRRLAAESGRTPSAYIRYYIVKHLRRLEEKEVAIERTEE